MYTKEQRLEIYKRMLSECISPTKRSVDGRQRSPIEHGFCWMYFMLYGTNDMYHNFETVLPELYEKHTIDEVFMFRSWQEREKALCKCIEELQTGGGIV